MDVKMVRHPSGLNLPILLDDDGLPVPLANEWVLQRRGLSPNTLTRNLRELAILFTWLDSLNIDFGACMAGDRMFTEAELAGSLCEHLRMAVKVPALQAGGISTNQGKKVAVSPLTYKLRLITVRQFMGWCFRFKMGTMASGDPALLRIQAHKEHVNKVLSDQEISNPPQNKSITKGLRDHQVTALIWCVDFRNPEAYGLNEHVRFRNFIVVMIMLTFGLRPAEVLTLRVGDVEFGGVTALRVLRRVSDPNDVRSPRPRVKRNGRDMIMKTPTLIRLIEEYIEVHRESVMERFAKDHNYLIISDEGDPLHGNSVSNYFQIIREKFKQVLPSNLTPKALRHTYSSRTEREMAERGVPEDERKQVLAYLRGDSSVRSQEVYIIGEIIRQATSVQSKYHDKLMETFLEYSSDESKI
ncbi:integrase [Pseudomonas sp. IB20]|uniref:tyrosine-type recombinase/integrase n=1 Tax=Pseudomonas sp. IB20 TaxID=1702250 RepID=UPI000B9F9AC3|nr:site-specific integrase [Pseudomonas sp. IB20]OZO04553.1 integrase [Pseudomonas sp. IB20]